MTLLRLGFLVLLWAFVYFVVRVLRSDLYGTRIPTSPAAVPAATAPVTPTPTRRKLQDPHGSLSPQDPSRAPQSHWVPPPSSLDAHQVAHSSSKTTIRPHGTPACFPSLTPGLLKT